MDADMDVKWTEAGERSKTQRALDRIFLFLSLFSSTPDARLTITDTSSPDQFHVVTVSDTGRNWSDQEVRALVQVWSDERVCKQLENSTRKRDIFVQISNRLMQQGIERDWKQCHTKYKNLKYLYRSLQRGKSDEADPRRLMRFYDEVDAIMNRTANGSKHRGAADGQADSGRLATLEDCEENQQVEISSLKMNAPTTTAGAVEERSPDSCSISSTSLDTRLNSEERMLHSVQELHLDHQHKLMSEPKINIHSC